jgi:general stress protein CsbA
VIGLLALLGNVVLWVGYAFAAFFLALLVYAASQRGARELATWVITLSVCAASIVIGFLIRCILGGNRKAQG